ncbi:MAG: helix-turn-helix transcriptional regulator [Erysipelotrichaceae bacterium]|nr:helix-turn-helix transcriptional regulator [Erysipelotrichaceae bacterium]
MAKVSYAKLWKKLEENGMKKMDLVAATKISTNALAKLGKNEDVRVNILVKICEYFRCSFDDIAEIVNE